MGYDVWLSDDGDLPVSSILLGVTTITKNDDDITVQKCVRRMKTFEGEWLLDFSKGMPYHRWMNKKVDINAYKLFIKADVQEIPEVNRVEIDGRLDVHQHHATLTTQVVLNNGQTRFLSIQPMTVLYQNIK